MNLKAKFINNIVNEVFATVRRDALDSRKVFDILLYSERLKDRVVLGTVADELANFLKFSVHVHALDCDASSSRFFFSSECFEGSRFTCSVDTKQGKTLTFAEAER